VKRQTKRPGFYLLVPSLVALLLSDTGCSMLIASHGGRSLPVILPTGSTRQEVRQTLGAPDSSENRDDGARVETYHIRTKVKSAWAGAPAGLGGNWGMAGVFVLGAMLGFEVLYAMPKAIHDSEKATYQVDLVYGPDGRLEFFYSGNASPEARFAAARSSLDQKQREQLQGDECPSWSACLTAYGDRLRTRAAWTRYTLSPTDEENVQRLLEVSREKDDGRIRKEEALLFVQHVDSPTEARFAAIQSSLGASQWKQLEKDDCPSWSACLTAYVDQVRKLAALQGYALSPADEGNVQRLLQVAREKDDGRMTTQDALAALPHYRRAPGGFTLRGAFPWRIDTSESRGRPACHHHHHHDAEAPPDFASLGFFEFSPPGTAVAYSWVGGDAT